MRIVLGALSFFLLSMSASGQSDEAVKKEFNKYNINGDSWLDGIEVTNCKCKGYDTNNNGEVSFAEFKTGITGTKGASNNQPSSKANGFAVNSPVEILYAGRWYPGYIMEIKGGQYKVHYDGYGENWDTWVAADLIRLKGGKAATPVTQPKETPQQNTQKVQTNNTAKGKRVEVRINGFWYKATVLDVKGDSYYVHYDGYSAADDVWILKSYVRDLDEAGKAVTVACNFTPPPGNFTNSSPASDALFKREIYDWHKRALTGGVQSPSEIGIVFTVFNRLAPYQNTVTNVPGQGATRRHEGAPANTTIYTVKTTYFVCERFPSGVGQKQVNTTFSFYKSREGEWTCSKDQ